MRCVCFVFLLAGCHGESVSAVSTDATPTDALVSDEVSSDASATDTNAADAATFDAVVPDVPAFEVPTGDAACVDGMVYTPEAGVGGCPAGMVRLPAGGFSALDRSASFPKGFCIDVTEVTAGAYESVCKSGTCLPSTSCAGKTYGVAAKASHPMNCVTQGQADAYCKGLGKRLPTDAEWEYAERGAPASGEGNLYPWGGVLGAGDTCRLCWSSSSGGNTCAVGSFPAGNSPQGVMDLAGGVEEWTSTPDGSGHIRRGGGYRTTDPDACGADYGRGGDTGAQADRGFRCVKDAP